MSWAITAVVAAAAIQQYNQAQTAKKQDRAALAGLQEQRKFQEQANARMNQQLQELETSSPEDERNTLQSQIRQQLRAKQAQGLAGINATGGGDDVTMYAGQAAPTAVEYGDFIGGNVAAIDSPLYQRQKEGFERADVGSKLDTLRRHSAQEDALTRMKIAGIRDNPWLSLLSSGLSAYGTSGMSGGTMFGGGGGGQPQANLGGMTPQTFYAQPIQAGNNTMFIPYNNRNVYGIGPALGA